MSSVVGRNIVDVRVTLAVTIRGGFRSCRRNVGIGRSAPRTPIERVPRVALERRRQPGIKQACPRHRVFPVPMPDGIGGLGGASTPRVVGIEQRELVAVAQVGTGHAQEPHAAASIARRRRGSSASNSDS